MNWIYKGKPLKKVPKDAYGFVYSVTYLGGTTDEIKNFKFYIGKKVLEFSKKKRLTIKEKKLPENKRKRFKIEKKESDWQDYWGSSILLLNDVEKYGKKNFERRIISFYYDKINLTYGETETQFRFDVLRNDTWNISILGKFFRGKIK